MTLHIPAPAAIDFPDHLRDILEQAGVQTGELVLITETGIELLHTAPRGAFRIQ